MKLNKKGRKDKGRKEYVRREQVPRVLSVVDYVAEGVLLLPDFLVRAINIVGVYSVGYMLVPVGYLSLKIKWLKGRFKK